MLLLFEARFALFEITIHIITDFEPFKDGMIILKFSQMYNQT